MRGIQKTPVSLQEKPDQDCWSSDSKTNCRIKLGESHVLSCALLESPRLTETHPYSIQNGFPQQLPERQLRISLP